MQMIELNIPNVNPELCLNKRKVYVAIEGAFLANHWYPRVRSPDLDVPEMAHLCIKRSCLV